MNRYDTAIIGAGPAGMMAAITASQNKKKVILIEKNPQLGRKLLATGNGRCNLTNRNITIDRFHGSDPLFISNVLNQFNQNDTINFFSKLGLLIKEEDSGRIFPRSNQASSVVEILSQALINNKVDFLLGEEVIKVEKSDKWEIFLKSKKEIFSEKLIIATGGRAAHHFGSTGDGYNFAKKLGHSLTFTHAALVPIETVENWVSDVQGIKLEAKVWASAADVITKESVGDILFTNYGLSGTAIMAQAGVIAPLLKNSKVNIHLDIFPDISENKLYEIIQKIFINNPHKQLKDALIGLLPSSLIPIIISLSDNESRNIAPILKNITLTVSKLRPYKEAQVTAGGINSNEINPKTLESKIIKDLYFAGEILDVDADSGGFNLQWAWSSGYVAGKRVFEQDLQDD